MSVTHPEIAAQADGWDPSKVAAFSHQMMPWVCLRGHRWDAQLDSRARGRGCPYCANKRILVGENDFATTDPELAAQAHNWDPTTLTRGSGKKREWLCPKGHVWTCPVAQRREVDECAVCSGKQVLVGTNDFATTDPELAAQAHNWDPTTLTRGSGKKREWVCPNGHVHITAVSQVVRGRGCGVCAGQQILIGENDLKSKFPEVARQADGWNPENIVHGSSKKLPWICERGHTWTASVSNRTRLGAGCPTCAGNILIEGLNDIATKFPALASEAYGWNPAKVSSGSHQKLQWKCKKGHLWTAAAHSRTSTHATGCPICSGKKILVGYNDLKTTHPQLAAQADGWDTTTVSAGTNKKAKWRCEVGHTWSSEIYSRALNQLGCPICSGRKVLAGFNDLKTKHPELAAQADGWDASTLTPASNKIVSWKCSLGHRWNAQLNNRLNGRNCPVCSGKKVLAGFNDLATTHPDVATQADGWDPSKVGKGSNSRRWWKCEKGHRWQATPNSRTGGTGCPTCAQTGFDPNQPGWLYLIDNDPLRMFQIGISNFPSRRLNEHSKRDWEVIEVRGPMEGHLAQQLETAILHAVERRGAVLGHKADIEKFDGYSEAWTKDSLSVTSFKQLLDWVYQDDENVNSLDLSEEDVL